MTKSNNKMSSKGPRKFQEKINMMQKQQHEIDHSVNDIITSIRREIPNKNGANVNSPQQNAVNSMSGMITSLAQTTLQNTHALPPFPKPNKSNSVSDYPYNTLGMFPGQLAANQIINQMPPYPMIPPVGTYPGLHENPLDTKFNSFHSIHTAHSLQSGVSSGLGGSIIMNPNPHLAGLGASPHHNLCGSMENFTAAQQQMMAMKNMEMHLYHKSLIEQQQKQTRRNLLNHPHNQSHHPLGHQTLSMPDLSKAGISAMDENANSNEESAKPSRASVHVSNHVSNHVDAPKDEPIPYPEVFAHPGLPQNMNVHNFGQANSGSRTSPKNSSNSLAIPVQTSNSGTTSAPATQPASPATHRAHPYLGTSPRTRSVSPQPRDSFYNTNNQLSIPQVLGGINATTINYKFNSPDNNLSSYNSSRRSSIGSDYPNDNPNSPINFGSDGLYSDDSFTQNSSGGPIRSPRNPRRISLKQRNSLHNPSNIGSVGQNSPLADTPKKNEHKLPEARHTVHSTPSVNSQHSVPEIVVTPTVDSRMFNSIKENDYPHLNSTVSQQSFNSNSDNINSSTSANLPENYRGMQTSPTSSNLLSPNSNLSMSQNSKMSRQGSSHEPGFPPRDSLDGISQSLMTSTLHSPIASLDMEGMYSGGTNHGGPNTFDDNEI